MRLKVQIKFTLKDRTIVWRPAESLSDFMQRINKTIYFPLDGEQLILQFISQLQKFIFSSNHEILSYLPFRFHFRLLPRQLRQFRQSRCGDWNHQDDGHSNDEKRVRPARPRNNARRNEGGQYSDEIRRSRIRLLRRRRSAKNVLRRRLEMLKEDFRNDHRLRARRDSN